MEPQVGDVVLSLAGRDKGRMFFVLDVTDGYALIADGKLRRAGEPKRKKLKHIRRIGAPDCKVALKLRAGDKVHSAELRKGMAEFQGEAQEGG